MTVPAFAALAPPAAAHAEDALPGADHGFADEDGFWNVVDGFSTKTGFRLTFIWDTDEAIAGLVRWGYHPTALDKIARPFGDAVDTAGVAMLDVPRSDVVAGREVFFRVEDQLTGELSPLVSFPIGNSKTADTSDGIYEVDVVVQLDTDALPDDVESDAGLRDIAEGMDIFAERVWDFTDGYMRIGKVLVTDTVLNYPVYRPRPDVVFFPGLEFCPPSQNADGVNVQHTMADGLFTTTVPFDSHVISDEGPAIASECHGMYLGRIGQLVVPWRDEMHVGAVFAHEFAHYAINTEDLYPQPGFTTADCIVGTTGVPNNDEGRYDISVMHNTFGWTGTRWKGSEFDRQATPCQRDDRSPTWDIFVDEYPAVPPLGRNGDGFPDHSDSAYNVAKGNPDGGALDIYILDNSIGGSRIEHFIKATTEPPVETPEVQITSPVEGAGVPAASVAVSGVVDRDAEANEPPTATLAGTPTAGPPPLVVDFVAAAADSDGALASWSMTFGDASAPQSGSGAPPASFTHTYNVDGSFTATLTVTDDDGATGSASVSVRAAAGVPQPDGSMNGNTFAYNNETAPARSCLGVSNVLALVTGTAISDDTPRYLAGGEVCISLRSSYSEEFTYDCSDPVDFTVWSNASGTKVAGPFSTTCGTEADLAPGVPACDVPCYFRNMIGPWDIPTTLSGEYFIVPTVTDGVVKHVAPTKKIIILGPPGSAGGSDDGHTIADADDDGGAPTTEIQWADVAVDATDITMVVKVGKALAPIGPTSHGYNLVVNGYVLQSWSGIFEPFVWDPDAGEIPTGAETTWDDTANTITMSVPLAWLTSHGVTAPYAVSVSSNVDPLGVGGVQQVDFAPDAGSVALALELPVTTRGSEGDPEASDPAGDAGYVDIFGDVPVVGNIDGDGVQTVSLPFMDVRKTWISAETPTTFDVTLKVEDMTSQPPSANAGVGRVATNYGVEFCLDNNVNAASGDGLFCYRLSAVNGVTGQTFSAGVIQQDNSGSCTFPTAATPVQSGAFNLAASTVTWTLRRAAFNVTANSADVAACTGTPIVRGGSGIDDGTVLSSLAGSTGTSAGAVIVFTTGWTGDTSDPATARPYVFGGVPLTADAGGPYSGLVGAPIAVVGTAVGGVLPYACAWSGPGATFADANACSTTVTYAAEGAFSPTLTVTDGASSTDDDTALVNVGGVDGERVELLVDGLLRGTVEVTTNTATPTDSWSLPVDLAGLTGAHTIAARWVDADGTTLDTDQVTVFVQGGPDGAFVTILNPADDPSGASPIRGVVDVDGVAGQAEPQAQGAGGLLEPRPFVTSTQEGFILAPCSGCQGTPATNPSLLTSATWASSCDPGEATDGIDGKWFAIPGFDGGSYVLDSEFDTTMDIWFFGGCDAQSAAKGSKANGVMPKTGTVPAGTNYAFVYIRRPTAAEAQNAITPPDNAILTVTSLVVAPSAPRSLAATPGPGTIALTWLVPLDSGGEPVSTYRIYKDGTFLVSVAGDVLTYVDSGDPGTSATYRVSAVNSAGEGPQSSAVTETFGSTADTTPPSGVGVLVPNPVTEDSVTLGWTVATDNVGVTGYEVRRDSVVVGTPTEATFVDTGLAPATTYSYEVRAFDASGNFGPASATVATTTGVPGDEEVVVTVDDVEIARIPVTAAGGTVAWATLLDTTTLTDGFHDIVATYFDGAGGSASDSARVNVQNTLGIDITAPAEGSNVVQTFDVLGTTTGTGGPGNPQSTSFLLPDRTLNDKDFALQVLGTPEYAMFREKLSQQQGFVGVMPALDGRMALRTFWSDDGPKRMDRSMLPASWGIDVVPRALATPLRGVVDGVIEDPMLATRTGPPVPGPAAGDGIGPGSHIFMNFPGDSNTYTCTANFVFEDPQGRLYLGAAGHCFLPGDKISTYGPDADYDASKPVVRVCVTSCTNGGISGFIITGSLRTLGPVSFARATGIGDDFGVVRIPDTLRNFVRPEEALWNGPTGVDDCSSLECQIMVHYGNGIEYGEVFATKGRAGLVLFADAQAWDAADMCQGGDSGSATLVGFPSPDTQLLEGEGALGILTHGVADPPTGFVGGGLCFGTMMAKAFSMANDAGYSLRLVLEGEDVNQVTEPLAPTNLVATHGDGQVSLTWTAPYDGGSPITGYTVSYGTTAGGPYTSTQSAAGTSATVTGLTNGQWYHFVVTATNVEGESDPSNEASARPSLAVTTPGAPTGFSALAGNAKVSVFWSPPSNNGGSPVTGYILRYGTSPGVYPTAVSTAGTSKVVTGLTNDVTYYFAVSAVNSVGEGDAAPEVSATPQGGPPTTFSVEVRALQGSTEVFGWVPVDAYDGSSWSYEAVDVPAGLTTIEARLLDNGVPVQTDAVTVTVEVANVPPIVDAGEDRDVHEGVPTTLTAVASDADGDFLTYSWTQVGGPAVALQDADTASASFRAPAVDADTVLLFEVEVDDGEGHAVVDGVVVTVLHVDAVSVDTIDGVPLAEALESPLAEVVDVAGSSDFAPPAGSQSTAAPTARITDVHVRGPQVTMSGATSTDLDGRIVHYSWSLGGVTSSGPTMLRTLAPGLHTAVLRVMDDTGAVAETTETVFVAGGVAATETYFLHKDECSTGANVETVYYMDRTPAPGEETDCHLSSTTGCCVGFEAVYPSTVPSGIAVPAGSFVQVHWRGFTEVPRPETLVAQLLVGEDVVGEGDATITSTGIAFVTNECQEWVIPVTTTQDVLVGETLTLSITNAVPVVDMVECYEGGPASSRLVVTGTTTPVAPTVDIASPTDGAEVDGTLTPVLEISGTATGDLVEVAVSDPNFETNVLVVTGTSSWSASWNLAGVPDGVYHVYARSTSGEAVSDLASVAVVVRGAGGANAPMVQVQIVAAGAPVSSNGWTPTTFDSLTGDWSYAWDTDAVADGMYDFHVRLVDGTVENAHAAFTASLDNLHAPVLGTVGDRSVDEGATLTIELSAEDEDQETLTFAGENLPDGASVDPDTGVLSWSPDFDDAGVYPDVVLKVFDPAGLWDSETVTLTVENVNRAPILVPILDRAVPEGTLVAIDVVAVDPDGDALTLGVDPVPNGATFDAQTGAFRWQPSFSQAGTYDVVFSASDGDIEVEDPVRIVVSNVVGAISIRPASAAPAETSPGVSTTLTFFVKNTGLATDVVHLVDVQPHGSWTAVVSQPTLTLAPGQEVAVTVAVTPSASLTYGHSRLLGTSDLGGSAQNSQLVRLPIVMTLTVDEDEYGVADPVAGTVQLRWLDATPAAGQSVQVSNRWESGLVVGATTRSHTSTAAGTVRFVLPTSPTGANAPGDHLVYGYVPTLAAGSQSSDRYRVVVS